MKCAVVLSGKRKCGKDYIASCIESHFQSSKTCLPIRLSAPLKKQFALDHELDYDALLDSSDYKEKYRFDMIRWGEQKREKEPFFFCEKVTEEADKNADIWIVTDARRKIDLQYFTENFLLPRNRVLLIRLTCSEATRVNRGFVFTPGIDDAPSECDLDDFHNWDMILENEDGYANCDILEQLFTKIVGICESCS